MDSMSSGHSSGDHVMTVIPPTNSNNINGNISSSISSAEKRAPNATKPVIVMPLEDLSDQDETPVYLR